MLVQRRPGALRLIPQHAHALASGRMARAWRGLHSRESPDLELILATTLHDAPWREVDDRPRLDPHTGLPCDFVTYPRQEKYAFIARGLDELERIHPRVGILVSLHHESFLGEGELPEWRKAEAARRKRLSRRPEARSRGADGDLALLQLFDNLSLFLCLTPPGSEPDSAPGWIRNDALYAVPEEERVVLEREWLAPDVLAVRPFPFARDVELELPYRDLSPGPYGGQAELQRALDRAEEGLWKVRLVST